VLYVGNDLGLSARLRGKREDARFDWSSAAWNEWPEVVLGGTRPDIVLMDLVRAAPTAVGGALLSARGFRCLLLLSVGTTESSDVHKLLTSPSVDFLLAPPKTREVWIRIECLLNRALVSEDPECARRLAVSNVLPVAQSSKRGTGAVAARNPFPYLAPELHDPESGRLDARRVSAHFGLPLAEVARVLGRGVATVHKTPDAPSLQSGLALFERVAVSLRRLAGPPDNWRIWLNATNPDLGGETPLFFIRNGKGQIVAELLEDALFGQPG
jgi:hypothetical protein